MNIIKKYMPIDHVTNILKTTHDSFCAIKEARVWGEMHIVIDICINHDSKFHDNVGSVVPNSSGIFKAKLA